jgi:hypothetical protein
MTEFDCGRWGRECWIGYDRLEGIGVIDFSLDGEGTEKGFISGRMPLR